MSDDSVSIHAPVRERPQTQALGDLNSVVSIHAPVRERPTSRRCTVETSGFDPRPREGATGAGGRGPDPGAVSIHAPVRERLGLAVDHDALEGFDPRPREGATGVGRPAALAQSTFRSTPP